MGRKRKKRKMKSPLKKILFVLLLIFAYNLAVGNKNLNVDMINQYPSLPNGCEVTSLTMCMNYWGVNVDKNTMASEYLPKTEINGGDPDKAFIGNPFGRGYYCYAKPIVKAANDYFAANGLSDKYVAEDITGAGILKLRHMINKKRPVVVWYTIDGEPLRENGAKWVMENGKTHKAYSNSHCIVLTGYTPTKVIVNDPTAGKKEIGIFEFMKVYYNVNRRAVVIKQINA